MNRLASAFPPIHELPAMFCAYALTAFVGWALLHPYHYRALVLSVLGVHA
jgi:hypothetical protein